LTAPFGGETSVLHVDTTISMPIFVSYAVGILGSYRSYLATMKNKAMCPELVYAESQDDLQGGQKGCQQLYK